VVHRDLVSCDPERAVDQLVDELSARVWRLRVLIEGASPEPAGPDRIRAAACTLVARMAPARTGSATAADQLMAALWSDDTSDRVSDGWWSTPLGTLVERARSVSIRPALDGEPAISVEISDDGVSVTATLRGEFDLAAIPTVTAALCPHLGMAVIVDLAAIDFLDSSGLHCLLDLRREAASRGGQVTIENPSPVARRVLQIAGLRPTVVDW
jgi:anti-sigma B factor antagonist